jgi:hypothetical protein
MGNPKERAYRLRNRDRGIGAIRPKEIRLSPK